jgi:hypothetical protein
MKMTNLWMREAEVIIGGVQLSSPPMEIHFRVDFDADPEPNLAEVKIYNLADDTLQRLKKKTPVILNAGYKGNVGTIFVGQIIQVQTEWEGVDKVTTIEAGDAADVWLTTTVSRTFKPGMKASQIIRHLIGEFGLEVGNIRLARDLTYLNGKSCYGPLQDVLRQIIHDCQSKMYVTNGVILIRPEQQGTQTGFLLNSASGLIGTPGLLEKEQADYALSCLLNHRLTTDSLLRIQSRTANGDFRVVKGSHIGDGSRWQTEMEVKAL